MSITLHPEPHSGEYRIDPRPTGIRLGPTASAPTRRIHHVDLLRSLVMVIIVLDYALGPLSRRYAEVKARSRAWWSSYL